MTLPETTDGTPDGTTGTTGTTALPDGERARRHAPAGAAWLDAAATAVRRDPERVRDLFPAVARHVGRAPLPDRPGWTADEAGRAVLLKALLLAGDALAAEVRALYRYGDAAEKRAVLRALPELNVGARCTDLLTDALRTNDTRLVAAALGPYARHLDDATWRQAVLKCVFSGVPLAGVDALDERADAELGAMLADLHAERTAAGRRLADDALRLLDRVRPSDAADMAPSSHPREAAAS
jgi:hypothetical protein